MICSVYGNWIFTCFSKSGEYPDIIYLNTFQPNPLTALVPGRCDTNVKSFLVALHVPKILVAFIYLLTIFSAIFSVVRVGWFLLFSVELIDSFLCPLYSAGEFIEDFYWSYFIFSSTVSILCSKIFSSGLFQDFTYLFHLYLKWFKLLFAAFLTRALEVLLFRQF